MPNHRKIRYKTPSTLYMIFKPLRRPVLPSRFHVLYGRRLYCLGISIGCRLARANASVATGDPSVRIALPIDMKNLDMRKKI